MNLSFALSPWWLIPALLLAGGLTYWSYRRTTPPVSTPRRALLMGLRFSALALIILLLLEPIARRIQQDERPPVLAVLVDASESITIDTDSTISRPEHVRQMLHHISDAPVPGRVQFFKFSTGTEPLARNNLGSLAFNGPRTDITQALNTVHEQLGDDNLQGILLLSDGQYNTGANPIYRAGELGVPIYTVALGDTARPQDVQIRRINTNEIAYVDREVPVQVYLRGKGFAGETVTVTLMQGDAPASTETVTLAEGSAEQIVELPLVPQDTGLQQFTVSVTEFSDELTHENNTARFAVRVLERRKRILLIAGAPSPDLSAIHQTLSADPDNEVVRRTQTVSGDFYEGELPSDLTSFDLIVLIGYPGPASTASQAQQIARAAEEQPVLFVLGRQTNLSMLENVFGDVLPVQPENIRSSFRPVFWSTTARGKIHPILNVTDAAEAPWDALPPLQYNASSWSASADARVLATVREQNIMLDSPLLVIRERSGHRSAALLAAGLYRWHNLPETTPQQNQIWPRLFSNLTQWVTTREDDRRVRVTPTKPVFDSREPVEFTGEVYNESLEPVDNASVVVTVTTPDSTKYPYPMQPLGNGRYELSVGTLPAGTYTYEAIAMRDTVQLGADRGSFAVGSVSIEFLNTRANLTLLRQIARRSSGFMIPPDSLDHLAEQLSASDRFDPVVVERVREARLWQWPVLLGLAILLLAGEWVLRKRSGMV